jgi:DNA polymerase I-like protein with 3'-5' exonuclease and polymerase domains
MKQLKLPNLRTIFIPDPGKLIFDCDLEQADAQVVAWEADDDELKALFRDPTIDVHNENCKVAFGRYPTGPNDPLRKKVKAGVHLTNYGGNPRTLSKTMGLTVHEASRFQDVWFGAHPGIKRWHDDVSMQLQTRRYVENKFGFRRFYFDRIEHLLPQALAWIPQSTVGLVINHGWLNIDNNLPEVDILLQVHDSLVGQYDKRLDHKIRPLIRQNLLVEVPYDDPLTIGVGIAISDKSWGDVKDESWLDDNLHTG